MGTAIAVGYAGGMWQEVNPAWLVGRNIGVHGFYLGRLIGRDPELVARAAKDVLRLWEGGAVRPIVGAEFPLEEAAEAHRLIESRQSTGKVVLDSMTALVTGAAGGIGSAIVTKLRAEGFDVKELDLVSGFDVTDPEAWEHIGSVDLACLNAGVLTGSDDIADAHRRAVPPRGRRQRRRRRLRRPPPRPRDAEGEHDHRDRVARRARRRSPTTRSTA